MSFQDFSKQRSQSATSSSSQSKASSGELIGEIRRSIQAISSNISSLQRQLNGNLSGNNPASHDILQKLNVTMNATQEMINRTAENIKRFNNTDSSNITTRNSSVFAENADKIRRLEEQKLARDFQVVVDRFQELQRVSAQKSRELISRARVQSAKIDSTDSSGRQYDENDENDDDSASMPLVQQERSRQQQLARLDNEIEFNESIIEEREEAIKQIENTIIEVNEIFRDLGSLVNEQQGMVDNIESNIESSASRTGDANVELVSANRYQKKAQNRLYWLLGIVVVVLFLLILVIILKSR